jgi:hypothetical protein
VLMRADKLGDAFALLSHRVKRQRRTSKSDHWFLTLVPKMHEIPTPTYLLMAVPN